MSLLTTNEVAERLGVTVQRIHALIKSGRLPAQKMGRDYFIQEEDLRLVEERKSGRPRKEAVNKTTRKVDSNKAKK
jgi:excisionase family DNA binding protein